MDPRKLAEAPRQTIPDTRESKRRRASAPLTELPSHGKPQTPAGAIPEKGDANGYEEDGREDLRGIRRRRASACSRSSRNEAAFSAICASTLSAPLLRSSESLCGLQPDPIGSSCLPRSGRNVGSRCEHRCHGLGLLKPRQGGISQAAFSLAWLPHPEQPARLHTRGAHPGRRSHDDGPRLRRPRR
jgi:hypothetical protein